MIASLGGLHFGYDFAVIAGAILFIKEQFALSPTMEEVIISAAILGAMDGAAVGDTMADDEGVKSNRGTSTSTSGLVMGSIIPRSWVPAIL